MLLTFNFFLNVVLFPPPPSEHCIFHGTVNTDFFISNLIQTVSAISTARTTPVLSFCYIVPPHNHQNPLPRYLYLKLLGLNSYFICVSIRLHIAFICRGKHLNTKLLKHNSQKCIQFLSLHREIWHFSSAYMNNSFSFLKIMPFQKNFSGRNLQAKNRTPSLLKKVIYS